MSNLFVKNQCIHSRKTAWCKHKEVPRALAGLGARVCTKLSEGKPCPYFETDNKRPEPPKGIAND